VKTSSAELIEQIKSRPESFFVARSQRNYDLFLDLYEQVGYAPSVCKLCFNREESPVLTRLMSLSSPRFGS
jgi:hypothetical protein